MSSIIKDIKLDDGSVIFVEMEEAELPITHLTTARDDIPLGMEEVSAVDDAIDALKTLKGTLGSFFSSINESLMEKSPDEWGAELNIGFKGKVNPIPVIVGTESSVAIKVHAKWVKTPR
jgi:hypothetical protein